MKYIILLLLSFSVFSQEQVDLSFKYNANTSAIIEMETSNEMKMYFQGDVKSLPEKMQSRLPMAVNSKELKLQNVITGEVENDGSYSAKTTFVKDRKYHSINGSQMFEQPLDASSMEGLTINGKVLPNGEMLYVSSEGKNISNELEAVLKSSFSQLGKIGELVGKKIRVGESVLVNLPMTIPAVNGSVIRLTMVMKYELVEIENGIANFDILYSTEIEMSSDSSQISVNGSGEGRMKYDVKSQFIPELITTINMDMVIPIGEGNLVTKNIASTKMLTKLKRIGLTKASR